jgi:hypothetical protein
MMTIEQVRQQKEYTVQTGYRAPEDLWNEIERMAKRFGVSKTALVTIALRRGLVGLEALPEPARAV